MTDSALPDRPAAIMQIPIISNPILTTKLANIVPSLYAG
jgi:hypothetical protein